MLVKLPIDKTVNEAVSALQVAAPANQSGVMQVRNLKETIATKAMEFAPDASDRK